MGTECHVLLSTSVLNRSRMCTCLNCIWDNKSLKLISIFAYMKYGLNIKELFLILFIVGMDLHAEVVLDQRQSFNFLEKDFDFKECEIQSL